MYSFVAYLVSITLTKYKLNRKSQLFVTINKMQHNDVILDEVIRIEITGWGRLQKTVQF